jgi:acyl carrier protein
MDQNALIEKLKEVIKPYLEDETLLEKVDGDTHLIDDLHINSANLVDIILDAEDAFDIEIDDESAERMITVKAALAVISEKIEA